MIVSFVGLGVVGLTTQICFASRGIKTIGIEKDGAKLANLDSGILPFHEPQLPELFAKVRKEMEFSNNIEYAIQNSQIIFVTVGTPSNEDGSINLSQMASACKEIGKALRTKEDYCVIAAKSTVVPTTTENVIKRILEEESKKVVGKDFGLVLNPEFLREGSGVYDTLNPHLVVIGSEEKSGQRSGGKEIEDLWLEFFGGHAPKLLRTNWVTAELIKYSNNAFLATKISFINSIANLCQQLPGSDVDQVANAIGTDPRIGSQFLKAGPGYGGSCFPKDVKALVSMSKSINCESPLLVAVDQVNEEQPNRVINLATNAIGQLEGKRVAILGAAFKKDTDDIREAASVKVIKILLKHKARVCASDPMALLNLKKIFEDRIDYAKNKFDALVGAHCCIIFTEWDEYKQMTPNDFVKYMKTPCVIDARRIFEPKKFLGLVNYLAIGLNSDTSNSHQQVVELKQSRHE